ncbi:putative box C/D snoRNA protein [Fusarium oxysporum f. sp. albedinis]|nr:putative box C/D snoRNA protein [Fusarium oxysporum f. sp. albedinis]
MTGITDIYIRIQRPSDNSQDQEEESQEGTEFNLLDWVQHHRRMTQFDEQASPGLTDSVCRELRKRFPTYSTANS